MAKGSSDACGRNPMIIQTEVDAMPEENAALFTEVETPADILDLHIYAGWTPEQIAAISSWNELEIQQIIDTTKADEAARDLIRQAEAATLIDSIIKRA